MERVTSEPPSSYSKVVGHSCTVNNDPASKKNPYQRPDSPVQHDMEEVPFGTVYNSSSTQTTTSQPPGPITVTEVAINRLEPGVQTGGQSITTKSVDRGMKIVVITMIVLFFAGTPFSLFLTIPTLLCAFKVELCPYKLVATCI